MNVQAAFLAKRRQPRFKLPRGSCDAHCHVFGPGDKFPYAPNRRYTPADAPKEMLAALHAHLGIDRAVIVQASCHGADNAAMLDCIASDPKRYRGVAIVDDSFTDTDYDRLDRGGVRGVRFNFVKHLGGAPNMAVFNRVIDRVKTRGWHVVLHVNAPDIVPLSDMIRRLPLPFVIDHMGRVPLTATAVPFITPASGAGRSLIAMSAIAIRECLMYSMADLVRSARPFSADFCEPFRGTAKAECSTLGVAEIPIGWLGIVRSSRSLAASATCRSPLSRSSKALIWACRTSNSLRSSSCSKGRFAWAW